MSYQRKPSAKPFPPEMHLSIRVVDQETFLGRDEYLNESGYIQNVKAKIRLVHTSYFENPDDPSLVEEIGMIEGWVIQKSRMVNDGVDFWESCDEISGELEAMASTLFHDGDIVERLENRFFTCPDSILYIHMVELFDHKGHGIGLLAVRALFDRLSVDTLILEPAPKSNRDIPFDKASITRICAKLERYWNLLGLHDWSLPNDTMLLGMTNEMTLPMVENIVPHLFRE